MNKVWNGLKSWPLWRRVLCGALAVTLMGQLTFTGLANMNTQPQEGDLCPNHLEHDEFCGYSPATEEQPCGHEHTDECYIKTLACTHEHTEECGENGETCTHTHTEECFVSELNCQHVHDDTCGYAPASEGTPCLHSCPECDPAEPIYTALALVYNKDVSSAEHTDLAVPFAMNSDVFAALELLDGQNNLLQGLQNGTDFAVNENGLVLSAAWLETLEEGTHFLRLTLASGTQDFAVTIVDTSVPEDEVDGGTPEASATPDPSASPEASATPDPSASPEASATPDPSASPEASATPDPSASPEASATPEPSPTPDPNAILPLQGAFSGVENVVFTRTGGWENLKSVSIAAGDVREQEAPESMELEAEFDYQVADSELTLLADYLNSLQVGEYTLLFDLGEEQPAAALLQVLASAASVPAANTAETGYSIKMSASSIGEDETKFYMGSRHNNGILTVTVNAPKGLTGRVLTITQPEYGIAFTAAPPADANIESAKLSNGKLTVTLKDTVNGTFSLGIGYRYQHITFAQDELWGKGELPATGFTAEIRDSQDQQLAFQQYGNWKLTGGDTWVGTVTNTGTYIISGDQRFTTVYADGILTSGDVWGSTLLDGKFSRITISVNGYEDTTVPLEQQHRTQWKSVKLYVPDPSVVDFQLFGSHGSSIWYIGSGSIFKPNQDLGKYLDVSEPQQDENGWYVLISNDGDSSRWSNMRNRYTTYLTILYTLTLKEGHTLTELGISEGETLNLSPVEVTFQGSGASDLHIEKQPQSFVGGAAKQETVTSGRIKRQAVYIKRETPTKSQTKSPGTDIGLEASASVKGGGTRLVEEKSVMTSYTDPDFGDGAGTKAILEFPEGFSVQSFIIPKEGAILLTSNLGLSETAYRGIYGETSDGKRYEGTVNVSSSANTHDTVTFPNVPEGEGITKIVVEFDKLTGYGNLRSGSSGGYVSVGISGVYVDIDESVSGWQQIKQIVELPDGTRIVSQTDTDGIDYWYYVQPRICPFISASGSNPFLSLSLINEEPVNAEATLRQGTFSFNSVDGLYKNTVHDPQYTLSVQFKNLNSEITREEAVGYVLSGEFEYYASHMQGFTVSYKTRSSTGQITERSYVLPEGANYQTAQLPIPEGERLYGDIVFSKEGEVTFKNTAMLRSIQLQVQRHTDDGRVLLEGGDTPAGSASQKTLNISFALDQRYSDCNCENGQHLPNAEKQEKPGTAVSPGGKYQWSQSEVVPTHFYRYVKFGTSSSSYRTLKTTIPSQTIYQGESKDVVVGAQSYVVFSGIGNTSNADYSLYSLDFAAADAQKALYLKCETQDVVYAGGTLKADMQLDSQGISSSTTDQINASIEYIQKDGATWWKLSEVPGRLMFPVGGDAYMKYVIELYALPGATPSTGTTADKLQFSQGYIDWDIEKLAAFYNGSEESDYTVVEYSNFDADEENFRGEGADQTTMWKVDGSTLVSNKYRVLQKILAGVQAIPGVNGTYYALTQVAPVYNHYRTGLSTLVTISSADQVLTNYETVLQLPRKGTPVTGTRMGTNQEETVTSDFSVYLTGAPTEINNTGGEYTVQYATAAQPEVWINQEDVGDWNEIAWIKVTVPTMAQNSVITLSVPLSGGDGDKLTEPTEHAYLGGTYRYESGNGTPAESKLILAEWDWNIYVLEGTVWWDKDEDGTMDSEEAKQQGITVELRKRGTNDLIESTQTDESGAYKFTMTQRAAVYLKVVMPEEEGNTWKPTKVSANMTASTTDSDFDRTTNQCMLPVNLTQSYSNLNAGLIRLPVITAGDITVAVDKTVVNKISAQWDKSTTMQIKFDQAQNSDVATVANSSSWYSLTASNLKNYGQITGVSEGETSATVTIKNSLGDEVSATYNITVASLDGKITVTKNLTGANAKTDETFLFEVTAPSGQVYYLNVAVPKGKNTASAVLSGLTETGTYTVKELDSNWRWDPQTEPQTVVLDKETPEQSVSFTNKWTDKGWVQDSAKVSNQMQPTA